MCKAAVARRLRFGAITPPAPATGASWSALALLLLVAGCGGTPATAQKDPAAGDWRAFEGNWTASGTRTSLDLGSDHRASIVHLNGSLLLSGVNTPVGFGGEFVGFTDTQSGMVGRAVWTDERGDQVFSDLKGEWVGTGNRVAGTFIGGTGRYSGATGEYEFQWQYVLAAEAGAVSGRTSGLKGRVRVGAGPVQ